MKILVALLIVVVAGIGVIWWLGARLPVRHRAGVAATLQQTPEAIFDAITDVAHYPQWRKDVKSVELLAEKDGRQRFRETGANGVIAYRIESADRPQRFVTRIDDPSLPFGGGWTFALTPSGDGCRI